MAAKTSPLPWEASETQFAGMTDIKSAGQHIMRISHAKVSAREADAALIVRAVNSHDALLAALLALVDYNDTPSPPPELWAAARAAIAKAGGK